MVLSCALVTVSTGSSRAYAQEQPAPDQAQQQTAESQTTDKDQEIKKVTVRSGDSLSKIAKRNDTTYKRIFYFNKSIKNPDVIHPGQKLKIPSKNQKLKARTVAVVKVAPKPFVAAADPATSKKPETTTAPAAATYTAKPKYVARATSSASGSTWDRLAACESGGNWQINTGNGYYGGLQFSLSSWRGVGGSGYPHQASKSEQIRRASMLKANGGWGHWPACSAKLGLR